MFPSFSIHGGFESVMFVVGSGFMFVVSWFMVWIKSVRSGKLPGHLHQVGVAQSLFSDSPFGRIPKLDGLAKIINNLLKFGSTFTSSHTILMKLRSLLSWIQFLEAAAILLHHQIIK